MKLGKLFGWGIVIYAIMQLAWSGLVIYGLSISLWSHIIELIVLVALAIIAGRSLRFDSWKDVLPYSFGWAVVVALLDTVYSVPFAGWEMYADWNVWIGYALVLLIPLFAPYTKRQHHV